MEKKKIVPTWVSVILLALCAVSIIGNICMLVLDSYREITHIVSCILSLCAVALAMLYCFKGYKKTASKLFMAFSIVLTIFVLVQFKHYMVQTDDRMQGAPQNITTEQQDAIPNVQNPSEPDKNVAGIPGGDAPVSSNLVDTIKTFIKISIPALIFAMLFTLTVAKDLGRKKSFWLIGLSVALSLVNLIMAIVRAAARLKTSSITIGGINAGVSIEFSIFVLCVIYGIMIYAKYQDKAARGSV